MRASSEKTLQQPTLCIVGDGETEEAFIHGFKRRLKELGLSSNSPCTTVRALKMGGGNPMHAIGIAQRKIFSTGLYHRRILIIDTEGTPIAVEHHKKAATHGIEIKFSHPCIERHLLRIYGAACPADLSPKQYKSNLYKHFCTDRHRIADKFWHLEELRNHDLKTLIQRDELTQFLFDVLTRTDQDCYKAF